MIHADFRLAFTDGYLFHSRQGDLRVMRKIVWALSQVGTPDTIPILENYLRTGRVQARTIVQRSIAEIRRRYDASG